MSTGDTPLILVQPADTISTLLERIRAAGVPQVQLLVPDGVTLLHGLAGFAELRLELARDHIKLLVISADSKTLAAAQKLRFETMAVATTNGTSRPPMQPSRLAAPATQPVVVPPAPLPPPAAAPPSADAQLLDELDEMPLSDLPGEYDDDLAFDDDDLAFETPPGRPATTPFESRYDEDWDTPAGLPALPPPRAEPPDPDQPPWRNYSARRARDLYERQEPATPTTALARRTRPLEEEAEPVEVAPATNIPWMLVVPIALVLLALGIGAVWLFTSRATVVVSPPTATANSRAFQDEIIPLSESAAPGGAAIQARQVAVDADITVEGRASQQLTPVGVARGNVQIINRLGQRLELPQGTEFVANNPAGQEVRFLLDAPAIVPPAVTVSSLTGNTTTFGQIEVAVSARSPGSASNVAENSISQIVVPGQAAIANGGNFSFFNSALAGGSEAEVAIVTEPDVQQVLGDALSRLYEAGASKLAAEAGSATLDASTIYPDPQALSEPTSYEISLVNPPVGQRADDANPVFSVTLRARFSGLATPAGQSVATQLNTVAPTYFQQRGSLPSCPLPATTVSSYRWDGRRLTISGEIGCVESPNLSAEALSRVRSAVSGKTREAAEAGLRELQRQGVIGSYGLPDRASLPGLDLLLNIEVGTPQPAQPEKAP